MVGLKLRSTPLNISTSPGTRQIDLASLINRRTQLELLNCCLSGPQNNRAINFFFVADINGGDAGFTLAGLSGGIPGPPGVHGTARSGVVVNMGSYLEAIESGDAEQIESARSLSEIIFAHETGHYLGLFHTTERNGAALGMGDSVIRGSDNLSDTPVCPDSADTNGNGLLSASECMDDEVTSSLLESSPNLS